MQGKSDKDRSKIMVAPKSKKDPSKDKVKSEQETPEPTVEALQDQLKETKKQLKDKTKLYGESSTEGKRLAKVVKGLKAKLRDKLPSETPLEQRIPDWDILSEEEKQAHRDKEKEKKRLATIEAGQVEEKKAREFSEGFDELVTKEEFKILAKRKAKFREYCSENPGMPIEAAAKSFLFDKVKEIAAKDERKKLEREGLEEPSGGDREPSVPEEGYTAKQVENLRLTNQSKYDRLVREGKLKLRKEE